eukprot:5568803-Alexandrium_andersonii.AAC.1
MGQRTAGWPLWSSLAWLAATGGTRKFCCAPIAGCVTSLAAEQATVVASRSPWLTWLRAGCKAALASARHFSICLALLGRFAVRPHHWLLSHRRVVPDTSGRQPAVGH